MSQKSLFIRYWCLTILGSVAAMPQLAAIGEMRWTTQLISLYLAQQAVLFGFCVASGLYFAKRVNFPLGQSAHPLKLLLWSTLLASMIYCLDAYLFQISALMDIQIGSIWTHSLASFYGGINEEIMMRLFVVSGVVFFLTKVSGSKTVSRVSVIFAVVVSAVLFGTLHLPALAQLVELTPLIISRTIILNGIMGIYFGFLFCRYGFLSAMCAHFIVDLWIAQFIY